MKYLLLLLTLSSCIYKNGDGKIANESKMDTVFIDKDKYPELFIEPIPKNKFSFINEYGVPDSCGQEYQNSVPSKWIEIEQLKGTFSFYLWQGLNKLIFCNDGFYEIINSGDHPGSEQVLDFTKKSNKEFCYVVSTRYHDNKEPVRENERLLNFYIIDEENEIAIVEDTKWGNKYHLMIAQNKEYNIPVLVHQSTDHPILYSYDNFDAVDYEQILKEEGFK